jgi:aspartyl/glutamyl-tRNA(Asn/Gln) amidotransferase C subunit
MATNDDVQKLASLARIRVSEDELAGFTKDFESILGYISQLERADITADAVDTNPSVRNVFREDADAHAPGAYTEALTEQFPERKGNYLSVKQIISHD